MQRVFELPDIAGTTGLSTIGLICLSGTGLSLAFPPFMTGFIAFVGLLPLLYFLRGVSSLQSIKIGFLWGLGFHAATLYWICFSTIAGGISAVVFLAFQAIFFPLVFAFGYRVWGGDVCLGCSIFVGGC